MSGELPIDAQNKIVVFGIKRIRRSWHDEQWFFSVVDIVGALTDSPNPRNYWNMMKAREQKTSEVQVSTLCVQLKLTSTPNHYCRAGRRTKPDVSSARSHSMDERRETLSPQRLPAAWLPDECAVRDKRGRESVDIMAVWSKAAPIFRRKSWYEF